MKYTQQLKNNKHLVISFVVLILVVLVNAKPSSALVETSVNQIDVTTVIPKGYVLVPIELENKDSISSVIQSFGIIDLYSGDPQIGKSKKVASCIKIIRAPYNQNLFAVLVKDDLAQRIMNESGRFFAVIQNKAEAEGSNTLINNRLKTVKIEYQN
jgi:hypothetical protein